MNRRDGFLSACAFVVCLAFLSCGGGSNTNNSNGNQPPSNPVPAVQSMSPNTATLGSSSVTLTVTGSNFVQGSTVLWNGSALATTFVSATQVTATVPAADFNGTTGNVPVTVSNPSPGGGTSASLSFAVQSPMPLISSLGPTEAGVGTSGFTLTVNGSNFINGAAVYWNGSSRTTSFVSSTQLTATITASDLNLSAPTTVPVTVQNPAPSVGPSNAIDFMVANAGPAISTVSPQTALAGSGALLTINGTGFANGATVEIAGQAASTMYSGSTQLIANVPTTLVGDVAIVVANPSPNAGVSNVASLSLAPGGKGVSLTQTSIAPDGSAVPFPHTLHGSLSADARYFVFGNFLRDTCFNAPNQCTPQTIAYADASQLNYNRSAAAVTSDGQFVASSLTSFSGSIPQGDLEFTTTCLGSMSGCSEGTQVLTKQDLLSIGSIAANGRYVSYKYGDAPPFSSTTSVSGYVYDTCTGVASGCAPAELTIDPTNSSLASTPQLSSDGRYAVYSYQGTTNREIVLRDTCLGVSSGCTPTSQVLSDTTQSCWQPLISSDGQWVTYVCSANGSAWQVFVENTCAGSSSCTPTAEQLTFSAGASYASGISNGGRYITYYGGDGMLAGYVLPGQMLYVYDTCNGAPSGCMPQSGPVCLNAQGAVADANCQGGQISDDGKYIYFNSEATNLSTLPSGVTGASYIAVNPLQ